MKLKAKNKYNQIIEFDVIDGHVNCMDKNLCKILYVPDNVTSIDCNCNLLESLPNLPNLIFLDCSNNQIMNLPELPNITNLYCTYNQLISLPELPNIKNLNCSYNKLISLPALSNIAYLDCSYNKFSNLNEFENFIKTYNNKSDIDILIEKNVNTDLSNITQTELNKLINIALDNNDFNRVKELSIYLH